MKEEAPVLFDVDDTLFNKVKFKENFNNGLANSCNEPVERIDRMMSEYIGGLKNSDDFKPNEFIQYLGEMTGKRECFENFKIDNPEIYTNSLFNETLVTLSELKKIYGVLGVFSQGFVDFQNTKIDKSGIRKFFDEKFIYIGRDKLDPEFIKTIPEGSIIIDDKKSVVEKLNSLNRFKVIWINRKTDEKMDGVPTIKSLEELFTLFEQWNLSKGLQRE